jgi:hypothetical protein
MKRSRLFIVGAISALAVFAVLFMLRRMEGRLYEPQSTFNSAVWTNDSLQSSGLSSRQTMLRDLVLIVLPDKSRLEVEALLGKSPTHDEMRRMTPEDFLVRERNEDGTWKPFPRSGTGFYYSEFDWDLIYFIGMEQTIPSEYNWPRAPFTFDDGKREQLVLRFDSNGVFCSWYVDGSKLWPRIVGKMGRGSYSEHRRSGSP